MKTPALLSAVLAFTVVVATGFAAPSPRETFLSAKQAATDANFRNDQAKLRAALATFSGLAGDADARATLTSAADRLRALSASQPDDADAILRLARLASFRPNSRWIATRTGLPLDAVNGALARLLHQRQLVMESADRWTITVISHA